MMQRRRRTETAEPAEAKPVELGAPAAVPQAVRVIAGADVQDMAVAGRRVGDVRTVARAIFAINPAAVALVDGRRVDDDHLLAPGQVLEFVKYAGQKGAAGAEGVVIEMQGDSAVWRRNGRQLGTTSVRSLLDRVVDGGRGRDAWRLHPPGVRLMVERGNANAAVIEMPPSPRVVRWITDDSPVDYGPNTRCGERRLAFPYVVLIVVFSDGELTMIQQAFYRTAPIASLDDELYFTNLLNVATGYGLPSWVCLANLSRALSELDWGRRVRAVTDHFWHATFTRSSEVHEGNSFWKAPAVDPRLATPEAWAQATAEDPYFVLRVPWRRAPQCLGDTVEHMLGQVAPWRPVEGVEQLVTLMQEEDD